MNGAVSQIYLAGRFCAAFSFALLSLNATAARAEAITIQAAEATDATRIGLDIGSKPFFVDTAAPRQLDVVIPETGIAFDLSALLLPSRGQRIDSARALLDEDSSRVRLVMNCDCTVSANIENGRLWVNLRDPAQAVPEVPEAAPEAPASDTAAKPPQRFASAFAPGAAPSPWPRGVAPPARADGPEMDAEASAPAADLAAADAVVAEELDLARKALIRQLARAAEQGLLDFASEQSADLFGVPDAETLRPRESEARETPTEEAVALAPSAAPEPTEAAQEPDPEMNLRPQPAEIEVPVRSRTAWDKTFRSDRGETWVRLVECAPDEAFSMPEVRGPEAREAIIARLNNELVNEFDEFDAEAVERLARLWISLGFGAEVRALLTLASEPVARQALLEDLSYVVDGEHPSVTGPLALMGPCSPLATIWFEAAGFYLDGGAAERQNPSYNAALHADDRAQAMVDAFSGLPVQLRILLGPRLMGARLDKGDAETARLIDLLLQRMVAPPSAEHDLARARLMLVSDQAKAADALFARLARESVPEAREALLQLADRVQEEDAMSGPALADALGDAAMLARGSADFRRLKVAEIRTRALSEGVGPALDQVAYALERAPADRAVLTDAAHAALETARADARDPLEYARAVLNHADLISKFPAGDQARRRVAAELTDIGLANAALTILEPAAVRAVPALRREEARAQIALQNGNAALQALGDLSDPASSRLRAEALLLMSQPDEAFAELSSLPAPDAADQARLALLSSNWREAAREGPAARRILAAGMAQDLGGETDRPDAPAVELDALRALPTETAGAAAALLSPARVKDTVTLSDAEAVIENARAIRGLIEEALPDG